MVGRYEFWLPPSARIKGGGGGGGGLNSPPRELVDRPSSPFSKWDGSTKFIRTFLSLEYHTTYLHKLYYCATVTDASDCTRIIRRTGNAMCPDPHAQKVCIESMHLVKVYICSRIMTTLDYIYSPIAVLTRSGP